ncbi:MAG: carbon-phosphorus lyase complex subunit PhnI [Chloroflexota bacterium]|nr:carbon-phosphorus lyase complex subunit PhnI [Chloroflexota bacterium]
MAYTSVTGGADAIAAAERLIQHLPIESGELLLELRQIRNQLRAAVDQVMGEGGLYAPDLAALAFRQAEGDMAEASFMVRAYRSTLPRLGYALPVSGNDMRVVRRISSTFRDVPGGQLLGRTRDYTQRLLDLDSETSYRHAAAANPVPSNGHIPNGVPPAEMPAWDDHPMKVSDAMRAMGLIADLPDLPQLDGETEPADITRHSMRFPVSRSAWLQSLARAETGALVCLAYSSLRGYGGGSHGTIAELRVGDLPIRVTHPLTGEPLTIGHCRVTECEMTGGQKKKDTRPGDPRYGLSYGLVFGQNERKAISMSLLDSSLMAGSTEEGNPAPANDQEMVLSNTDGIESFGFVEHLKLPHFVTFGCGLEVSSTKPADVEIEDPVIDELDVDDARELAGVGAASTEGSSS